MDREKKNAELIEKAHSFILKNTTDIIFLKDINLVYREVSMPFVKLVGKTSPDEIIGLKDREIISNKHLAKRYETDDQKILAWQKDLVDFIEPLPDDDGKPRYASTSKYLLRDDNDEIIGILGISRDVTSEFLSRQRYHEELRYLFDLPSNAYAVSYIDVDDWRIIKQKSQNISEGTLHHCESVDELCECALKFIEKQQDELSELAGKQQRDALEFYSDFTPERLWEIYKSGRNRIEFEYKRRLSDGSVRWIHNEIHFLRDVDSGHLCAMLSAKDIDDSKQEEQKMFDAAKLDRMTRVLNRETAMDSIKQIVQDEGDKQHVLFMLDVDNFKSLNDTLGHQAGDAFLIALAQRLKKSFGDKDVVGRIGGDEFFMLMRNVQKSEQIENMAKKILNIVSEIAVEFHPVQLSGSVGIGVYPQDGKVLEELYSKADEALYEAKHSGKNQYRFA